MENLNIGYFLLTIGKSILNLGDKLYKLLTQSVNISWINKILDFFKISLDLPNELSLMWILTGGSVAVILIFIIIKVVA